MLDTLVIPFGLMNSPIIFEGMNQVFFVFT